MGFVSSSYLVTGDPGMYDAIFLPNTTVTWAYGTEYFYQPDGSYFELVGSEPVSNLKVQYSNATSTITGGFPYSNARAENNTTYGNSIFDENWVRALAYAYSYKYDKMDKQYTISAGKTITISDFYLSSSSNFNAITTTIKDEGAIALGIAAAGLTFAVMDAAASAFPGGATAGTLADIGAIASTIGFIDSVVNLATSFTLVVYTYGNLSTMTATNQIYNVNNPTSPITVSFYNTGGSTDFSSSNGTISYVARTPYENVTA